MTLKAKRKVAIKALFFLLVLYIGPALLGQEQAMKKFTIEDGLVQQQVTCLFKDKTGYLWIGTKGGVSRFDGQDFRNLSHKDGLPSMFIVDIFEDRDGFMWFATPEGLTRYDGANLKAFPFPNEWVQSRYVLETDRAGVFFLTREESPNIVTFSDGAYDVKFDHGPSAKIAIGYWDKPYYWLDSIGLFSIENDTITPIKHNDSLTIHRYRDIDDNWIQNEYQLLDVGNSINNYYKISPSGEKVWFIRAATKEGITVNTDLLAKDYFHFISRRKKMLHFQPQQVVPDTIILLGTTGKVLLPTDDGVLWIGTENGLIQYFTEGAGQNYTQPKMDYIWGAVEDAQGDLWFPRYLSGMTRMRGDSIWEDVSFLSAIPPGTNPYGFYFGALLDQHNDLYFPMDGGILRKHKEDWTYLRSEVEKINNTYLWLWEDKHRQQLVAGTKGGIQILKDGIFQKRFDHDDGIHNCSYIVSGVDDCNSNYWLGSYYGLSYLNPETGEVRNYTRRDSTLDDQGVISIIRDSWGRVWFGGVQNLMTYDEAKDSLVIFPINERIGSLNALAETDNGLLLVGGQLGILVIDLNAYHTLGTIHYDLLNRHNGYNGSEVNQNTMFKDSKGRIWVGSSSVTTCLNAEKLRFNSTALKPFIDKINGKPVPKVLMDQDTFFTLSTKNIELYFNCIGYNRPWETEYSYYLSGRSDEWSPWSTSNSVNFFNLPSGKYTLQLRTRTPGTTLDPDLTSFQLYVDLPLTQEPNFPALVSFLLSILLIFVLVVYTLNQRSRKKLTLANEALVASNKQVRFLHRERKHRIANDFIILKRATKKERDHAVEAGQVNILNRLLQRIDAIKTLHAHLNPDNQPRRIFLEKYLLDIVDNHRILLRAQSSSPTIQLNTLPLLVNSDSALHIGIIVNELLTNGLKYVADGNRQPVLSISYEVVAETFLLHYSDNGPGISVINDQDSGSGTGQYLIETSTRQLHGKREVLPSEEGLTLRFSFPLEMILQSDLDLEED